MKLFNDANFVRSLVELGFDTSFYLSQIDTDAPEDLVGHYLSEGWRIGLNPAPWFNTSNYLSANPHLVDSGVNPFAHYLAHGGDAALGDAAFAPEVGETAANTDEPYGLGFIREALDVDWYARQLEAARIVGVEDMARHYYESGWQIGLDPCDWFSTSGYLRLHKDVAEAGLNPLLHYLLAGRDEGRGLDWGESTESTVDQEGMHIRDTIAAEFNADFYLTTYADIAASGVDPLEHFLQQGWMEARDPNPFFSTQIYLDNNQDVAAAGVNPFYHYLVAGRQEGRKAQHEQGFRFDIIKRLRPVPDQVAACLSWAPNVTVMRPAAVDALCDQLFDNDLPTIISLSHDDFTQNVGGVQLCIRRDMRALQDKGWRYVHLFPAAALPVTAQTESPVMGVNVDGVLAGYVKMDALLRRLKTLKSRPRAPRSFIIHSLLGHSIDGTIALLKALRIKGGYFWLHDYAALCSNYKLMRNDVQFCGAPPAESLACRICAYGGTRERQIGEHVRIFNEFRIHLLSPSQAALNVFSHAALMKAASVAVIPHCRLSPSASLKPRSRSAEGPLRIGFLGYPSDHKGWSVFKELAVKFADDPRYEFHHLGKGRQAGLNIVYHEVVASDTHLDAMASAVAANEIDIVLAWSLWPETFCLVAYEAVAGGALILTNPDSGNVVRFAELDKQGMVIETEKQLEAMFDTDEIVKWVGKRRTRSFYDLLYSQLTAEVLQEITA